MTMEEGKLQLLKLKLIGREIWLSVGEFEGHFISNL